MVIYDCYRFLQNEFLLKFAIRFYVVLNQTSLGGSLAKCKELLLLM